MQCSTVDCVGMVNNLLERANALDLCCAKLSEEVCVAKHPSKLSRIPITTRSKGLACGLLDVDATESSLAVKLVLLSFDKLFVVAATELAAPENSSC